MRVAILLCGQYRSYSKNLENNLRTLYNPIIKDNDVDVYILTNREKSGNYSLENEREIISIFNRYNCKIVFIKHWEDLSQYHYLEEKSKEYFLGNCKHNKGYSYFMPSMYFQRYALNLERQKYYKNYDMLINARLFDMEVLSLKSDEIIKNTLDIKKDIIYIAIDTFFIGNEKIFNQLLEFGKHITPCHDDLWNDIEFFNTYKDLDYCLSTVKPTYASEIQLFAYIYYNKIPYKNIRYDYTNNHSPENINALFLITHCSQRKIF